MINYWTWNLFIYYDIQIQGEQEGSKDLWSRALCLHSFQWRDPICFSSKIGRTPENQESKATNQEMDEAALAVCHKRTKICSYYALPPSPVWLIEFLHGNKHRERHMNFKWFSDDSVLRIILERGADLLYELGDFSRFSDIKYIESLCS